MCNYTFLNSIETKIISKSYNYLQFYMLFLINSLKKKARKNEAQNGCYNFTYFVHPQQSQDL